MALDANPLPTVPQLQPINSVLSFTALESLVLMGGSPGVEVMGVDSCSEGRGFESQRRILDGHFFTLICCKIALMFV